MAFVDLITAQKLAKNFSSIRTMHVVDCVLMFKQSGRYGRWDIARDIQVLETLASSFVICNLISSRV